MRLGRRLAPAFGSVIDIESPLAIHQQGPERVVGEVVDSKDPPLAAYPRSDGEARVSRVFPLRDNEQFRLDQDVIVAPDRPLGNAGYIGAAINRIEDAPTIP